MENFEVLSPGKKIRRIRKDLRIKQHEITGGEITRNLISIIENDKANLTTHVADILSDSINKVCMERNIDFKVTSSYLLEDINIQVNRIADKYISYLIENEKNPSLMFEESLKNIETFLSQYDIFEKKVVIFEKIGNLYTEQKEYYKAYTYFLKAYENSGRLLDNIKIATLLGKLNFCCLKLKRYKEALDFNKTLEIYSENAPKDVKFKLLFNNALTFKNLGEHDKAIEEIERIEKDFPLSLEDKFDIFTIKANCLKQNKHFKEALSLHEYLLSINEHTAFEKKLIALCNILDIYCILNDTKYLKKNLAKCAFLIKDYEMLNNKSYACQVYNYIALAYYSIDDLALSKIYFDKAIKEARSSNDLPILSNSIEKLFSIFVKENNSIELDNLKNQLLELISVGIIPANTSLVLNFISYYNEYGDKESIQNLINFILTQ